MANTHVYCIHCNSKEVVRNGKQSGGKQRYKCKKCGKTFQLHYQYNASKPETKKMIIKMSLNGSGIRDISRVLEVDKNTVIAILKKLDIFLSMSIPDIKRLMNQ